MKKNLLALSMMATAGLFAQEGNDTQPMHQQSGACTTCCCTPCCCKPCCVPKPKKCVDCECYTPQFYDLQCDWGAFFDVEFLYWYAGETNLVVGSTALVQIDNADPPLSPIPATAYLDTLSCMGTSWDPGVRVGLGWNGCCDGWDLYLNWTYFKNSKKKSLSANKDSYFADNPGESILINPWTSSAQLLDVDLTLANSISARWRVRFNQIDLELGRKYWLSRCFALRPYAGLRGAWTRTNFDVNAQNGPSLRTPTTMVMTTSSDQFTNRRWGVGLLTGLQPTWYFCSNFALYANLGVGILWGEHKETKKQAYFDSSEQSSVVTVQLDTTNSVKYNCYSMSTLVDVAIGFRWEETWCCDRYRTALDIGWEHHTWFDYAIRHQTNNSLSLVTTTPPVSVNMPQQFTMDTNNLGYGGLVVRLRFDF